MSAIDPYHVSRSAEFSTYTPGTVDDDYPENGGVTEETLGTAHPAPTPTPDPTLTSLDPSTVENVGMVVVRLIGADFRPESVGEWESTPVPTTFVSATELACDVNVDQIPPDAYAVHVRTGEHVTANKAFTVTEAPPDPEPEP